LFPEKNPRTFDIDTDIHTNHTNTHSIEKVDMDSSSADTTAIDPTVTTASSEAAAATLPAVANKKIQKRRTSKNKKQYCIPKTIFRDLVREIMQTTAKPSSDGKFYWYSNAYDALQTDTEEYITERFKDAQKICDLVQYKTVQLKHFMPKQESYNTVIMELQL
jgi:histone H3/H4